MKSAQECLKLIRQEIAESAQRYLSSSRFLGSKDSSKLANCLTQNSSSSPIEGMADKDVVALQLEAIYQSMASYFGNKNSSSINLKISGTFATKLGDKLAELHSQLESYEQLPSEILSRLNACLLILTHAEEFTIYGKTNIIELMWTYLVLDSQRFSDWLKNPYYHADHNLLPLLSHAITKNIRPIARQILNKVTKEREDHAELLKQYKNKQGKSLLHNAVDASNPILVSELLMLGLSPEAGEQKSALLAALDKPKIFKQIVNHKHYHPGEGLSLVLAEVMRRGDSKALKAVLDCINRKQIDKLKQRFINNEFVSNKDETGLHLAVKTRDGALQKTLLDIGCDPRSANASGETCLDLAIASNKLAMLDVIITHPHFKPPKNILAIFTQCLLKKEYSLCEKLLQRNRDEASSDHGLITISTSDLDTALCDAVRRDDKDSVQFLLSQGACAYQHTESTEPALMVAVEENNLPLIERLLKDAEKLPKALFDACLLHASHSDHDEYFEYVLEIGIELYQGWTCNDGRDQQGTLLHHAVVKGNLSRIQLLLSLGALDSINSKGQSALRLSLLDSQLDIFECLLADKNALNTESILSALDVAVSRNDIETVIRLLDESLQRQLVTSLSALLNQCPARGQSLLATAITNQHAFMAEYLLSQGAILTQVLRSAYDRLMTSPQDYPLQQLVNVENIDALDCYITWGANPEQVNSKGVSALGLAITEKKMTLFKRILEHPSYKVGAGIYPLLHEAVKAKNIEALELLIAKIESSSAELSLAELLNQSHPSLSPSYLLSLAVKLKQTKMVKLLLLKGSNPEQQNENTLSPLAQALSTKRESIFYTMLSHQDYVASNKILSAMRVAVENNNHDALIALIEKAISTGLLGKPNNLLNQAADPISGDTLLHLAVRHRHAFMIDILVKHGADNTLKNRASKSARDLGYFDILETRAKYILHSVAEKEDSEQLLHYIHHGGCPFRTDKNYNSALSIIIKKNNTHLLQAVLSNCGKITQKQMELLVLQASCYKNIAAIHQLFDHYHSTNQKRPMFSRPDRPFTIDGKNTLHFAVEQGSGEMLSLLLNHGANFEVKNKQGESVLAYAARLKQWALMDILLEQALTQDSGISLAIVFAVANTNESMVLKLLDKTRECNLTESIATELDKCKTTTNPKQTALAWAVQRNNVFLAELFVSLGATTDQIFFPNHGNRVSYDNWRLSPKQYSLQHWVKEDNREKILDYMHRGASADKTTSGSVSALSLAISLDKGALVDVILSSEYYQAEPGIIVAIAEAIKCNKPAILSRLLKRAGSLENTDPHWLKSNRSALNFAVEFGRVDMLDDLLSHGANPLLKEFNGDTALSLAIRKNNDSSIQKMLPFIKSSDMLIHALMCALNQKNQPLVILLLDRLRDLIEDKSQIKQILNEAVDLDGNNLLHLAHQSADPAMMGLLLHLGIDRYKKNKAGAYPFPENDTSKDRGCCLMMKYAKMGNFDILEKLVRMGLSLDAVNTSKEGSVLMVLTEKHRGDELCQLVSMQNYKPNTNIAFAIQLAAKYNDTQLLHVLIEKMGSNPKMLSKVALVGAQSENATALHHAVVHDNAEMVTLLLNCGIPMDKQPKKGDSPLSYAILNRKSKALEAMLSHKNMRLSKDMECSLLWALVVNDIKTAKKLIVIAKQQNLFEKVPTLLNSVKTKDSHDSCLHLAVIAQHIEISCQLISLGADLLARNEQGITPLQLIIENTMDDVFKHLLSNEKYCSGQVLIRALLYAIQENQADYILNCLSHAKARGLLDKKQAWIERLCKKYHSYSLLDLCDISGVDFAADILSRHGFKRSAHCSLQSIGICDRDFSLQAAVRAPNYDLMHQLLMLGEDPCAGNPSALTLARTGSETRVFEALLYHPTFSLNQQGFDELLLSLVSSGDSVRLECVLHRFLATDPDSSSSTITTSRSSTSHDLNSARRSQQIPSMDMTACDQALIMAVLNGDQKSVSLLLAHGACPLVTDENNHTAICHALLSGEHEMIGCLINGMIQVKESIIYPITVAACIGNDQAKECLNVKYRQQYPSETVNLPYTDDNNPYQIAIDRRNERTIVALLQAQISPTVDATPPYDDCAMTHARREVPYLFQSMLNSPHYRPDQSIGQAFLDAISDGDYEAVSAILSKVNQPGSMISRKKLLNGSYREKNKDHALHIAVRKGNAHMVSFLLQQGADPKLSNHQLEKPQDLAEGTPLAALFVRRSHENMASGLGADLSSQRPANPYQSVNPAMTSVLPSTGVVETSRYQSYLTYQSGIGYHHQILQRACGATATHQALNMTGQPLPSAPPLTEDYPHPQGSSLYPVLVNPAHIGQGFHRILDTDQPSSYVVREGFSGLPMPTAPPEEDSYPTQDGAYHSWGGSQ